MKVVRFSTGRELQAYGARISIDKNLDLVGGDNEEIFEMVFDKNGRASKIPYLSNQERQELADEMIERWVRFAQVKNEPEFENQIVTSGELAKQPLEIPDDYPYVWAWCKYLDSNDSYAEMQIDRARQDKAPPTAIYRGNDGWTLYEDIANRHAKRTVREIVEQAERAKRA
jgi:hypothetical protein